MWTKWIPSRVGQRASSRFQQELYCKYSNRSIYRSIALLATPIMNAKHWMWRKTWTAMAVVAVAAPTALTCTRGHSSKSRSIVPTPKFHPSTTLHTDRWLTWFVIPGLPAFQRTTLKSWEWPGDETNLNVKRANKTYAVIARRSCELRTRIKRGVPGRKWFAMRTKWRLDSNLLKHKRYNSLTC